MTTSNPRWGEVSRSGHYRNPDKTASPAVTSCAECRRLVQNDAGTRGQKWHTSDTAQSCFVLDEGPPEKVEAAPTGIVGGPKTKAVCDIPDLTPAHLIRQATLLAARFGWDVSRAAAVAELAFGSAVRP